MSEQVVTVTTHSAAKSQALATAREELSQARNELRQALDASAVLPHQRLLESMASVRASMYALGKLSIAWVAEEVQLLLEATRDGTLDQSPGFGDVEHARVLTESIGMLEVATAAIGKGHGVDSSLAWLDCVNDIRALRGKSLMSEALVLALDIGGPESLASTTSRATPQTGTIDGNLPESLRGSLPTNVAANVAVDLADWQARCRDQQPHIASVLLGWFRAADTQDQQASREGAKSLAELLTTLLADSDGLELNVQQNDVLLVQCAEVVARALADGALTDSATLRHLFLRVEHQIQVRWKSKSASAVRDANAYSALLRNLLYQVALAGEDASARYPGLEARFDLSRLRAALAESREGRKAAPHLSSWLVESLYERARMHMRPLEIWLETGGVWGDRQSADARLARLAELDAMLTLFGLGSARQVLAEISAKLKSIEDGQSIDASTRLTLASAFLRVRNRLGNGLSNRPDNQLGKQPEASQEDRLAQQEHTTGVHATTSLRTSSDDTDGHLALAQRIAQTRHPVESGDHDRLIYASQASASLVTEARRSLAEAEPALDGLVGGSEVVEVPLPVVAARIRGIARALDILPLPEVSVLIDGLGEAIELGAPSNNTDFRRSVARLVVEIDACLDGFAQTGFLPSDMLDRAESALSRLRGDLPAARLMEGMSAASDPNSLAVDHAVRHAQAHPELSEPPADLVQNDRDQRALTMAALDALDDIGASLNEAPREFLHLLEPLRTLERIGRRSGHADLSRLCGAALDLLETSPHNLSQAQVQDLHAVLPQLIANFGSSDRSGSASGGEQDSVAGLDDLIDSLAPDANPEMEPKPDSDSALAAERVASAPSLLGASDTQSRGMSLHSVFVAECGIHLDTLDLELSSRPVTVGKSLVRALHTLGGSAQTVGAAAIVNIIEPMQQRVAERAEQGLDLSTTDVDDLSRAASDVRALLQDEWAVPDSPSAPASGSRPDVLDTDGRDRLAHRNSKQAAHTLADVFADEARELIARLRIDEPDRLPGEAVRARALSALHTLKGSARVAGWTTLAELAHEHESVVQGAPLSQLSGVLSEARRELEAASPGITKTSRQTDRVIVSGDARVHGDSWDRLIALSSDVSASQARLTVEIDKLGAAARELETAAHRWRRLPAASGLLESEAARELLADISSVRTALDAALRGVDSERRLGARAGRALQQDLVRARLVRAGDAAPRLQEVVADATVAMGVEASLSFRGEDTTLDGGLFRRLLPAIEQLLRNAVVHGIEQTDERQTAGKSASGQVVLEVINDSFDLVIRVVDDGRGVADGVDSIGQLERVGYSTAGDSGLGSTRAKGRGREQLGGHGLGLASIRNLMDELGGDLVLMACAEGAGFELRVPQQAPVQQIVLVEAGGMFGIPVNCVREVLPVSDEPDESRELDEPRALELADVLGVAQDTASPVQLRDDSSRRCLVLVSQGRQVRVFVDAVVGYREVVVQPLGQQLASLGVYSGGAALADGRCALLLSPAAWQQPPAPEHQGKLAGELPGEHRVKHQQAAEQITQPVVLVADDSPTQRAWLREHLEQWGLQVIETRDGQEALDRLGETAVDMLLLDIDMPRVDGFGVLDALGQWEADTPPIIMLSSRSSRRDREAALRLGATEFLAKPAAAQTLKLSVQRVLGSARALIGP